MLAPVRAELAPQGLLRVAINLGNPALVLRNPVNDELTGISIDLARALAEELGVSLALIEYQAAGSLVAALKHQSWDVGFLAIDPQRQTQLAFTRPYMQIEGRYLVHNDSPVQQLADVDQHGVSIAVSAGSAYDGFLSKHLRVAQLQRFTTSTLAFAGFCEQHLPVLAGVADMVNSFAAENSTMRVLDPPFMLIEQALATPIGRVMGASYIAEFIIRQMNSGFVAASLKRSELIRSA